VNARSSTESTITLRDRIEEGPDVLFAAITQYRHGETIGLIVDHNGPGAAVVSDEMTSADVVMEHPQPVLEWASVRAREGCHHLDVQPSQELRVLVPRPRERVGEWGRTRGGGTRVGERGSDCWNNRCGSTGLPVDGA